MTELGFNYRITDIQCALGASQLKKTRDWLCRRKRLVAHYQRAFSGMPELHCPAVRSDRESAWHLYVLRLNLERLRVDRDQIFRALRAENIGVNVHYIPVPWHPYYRRLGYQKGQWPVAERNFERMITLPLWPGMTDQDLGDVVTAVERVIGAYRK